jgi:hypothetical protein
VRIIKVLTGGSAIDAVVVVDEAKLMPRLAGWLRRSIPRRLTLP